MTILHTPFVLIDVRGFSVSTLGRNCDDVFTAETAEDAEVLDRIDRMLSCEYDAS